MIEIILSMVIVCLLIGIICQWIGQTLILGERLRSMIVVMEDGRYIRTLVSERIRYAKGVTTVSLDGNDISIKGDDDNYHYRLNSLIMRRVMSDGTQQPVSGTSISNKPSQILISPLDGLSVFDKGKYQDISLNFKVYKRSYLGDHNIWNGQGLESEYIVSRNIYPWNRMMAHIYKSK